jgi:hypothetical protein
MNNKLNDKRKQSETLANKDNQGFRNGWEMSAQDALKVDYLTTSRVFGVKR